MPNRILKESVNESRGLSQISPFAQDLFKRLITYADDYGRFNADEEIMLARLYPRELDAITVHDVSDALLELVGVEKVKFYRNRVRDNAIFGYMPNWAEHQRVRDSRAKCPDPETEEVNDWALKRAVPIALRLRVLERDQFACQECGRSFHMDGFTPKQLMRMLNGALHLDHIVPVTKGGRATEENLRTLCAGCNLRRPRIVATEELLALAKGSDSPQPPSPRRESPQPAAHRRESPPESVSQSEIESESKELRASPRALQQGLPPILTVLPSSTQPAPKPSKNSRTQGDHAAVVAVLVEFCGEPSRPDRWKVYGKAATDLLLSKCDADEVRRLCEEYVRRWPDVEITVTAIAKHVDTLRRPAPAPKGAQGRMLASAHNLYAASSRYQEGA